MKIENAGPEPDWPEPYVRYSPGVWDTHAVKLDGVVYFITHSTREPDIYRFNADMSLVGEANSIDPIVYQVISLWSVSGHEHYPIYDWMMGVLGAT